MAAIFDYVSENITLFLLIETVMICLTVLAAMAMWLFRKDIKNFAIGKEGLRFSTHSDSYQLYEVGETISHVDLMTKRKLKEYTMALSFKAEGVSPEVEDNIRVRAIQPLLLATYENHHTRELSHSTADEYFEDKIRLVENHIGIYRQYVTTDTISQLVSRWSRGLVRITVAACKDKIKFYEGRKKSANDNVSEILEYLIKKNEKYILYMENLNSYNLESIILTPKQQQIVSDDQSSEK